jgi:flagellar L-ring protein FlgH
MAAIRRMLGIAACLTAGCVLPPPPAIVQQPMTVRPQVSTEPVETTGAIFQAQRTYRPLFEDVRARNVGDTLIVQINEKTAANKNGATQMKRAAEASAEVGPLNLLRPFGSISSLKGSGNSSSTFDGSGQAASSNDFTGFLAVTVLEVLANGNLVVSGEKQIAMTQGTEFIRFSGVVHPRTILAGNVVSSTQVADARIEYKANGYLDEAQILGWLQRFFLSVMPF